MDLAELLDPSHVVINARATSKEQLLRDLAARAAPLCGVEARTIYNALEAREALGSTGLGEGFALPHARIEGLDHLFGMFVRLNRPIAFDSIDEMPVDLVFCLLVPASAGSDHLAALAAICRLLRDKTFAASLRKASDAGEVHARFCEPLRQS